MAQNSTPTIARPVVQTLPSEDSLRLSAALSRLGRDPRDVDALVDAGNAALAMGDTDAAIGFFKRANQVASKDSRVKAGLAGAMVRSGDPAAAIPIYAEAEKSGAASATMAADRGLAYDLVGDNASAQVFYRQVLARGADDEVTRRLAISQAISGDGRGFEQTLLPLLRDQDKAAWRTRAFGLAIMGQTEEAVRISKTILPPQLATQVAPYLRYMPQLTPAQQAAAAILGTFPRASEIGRDDPRIAQYAPAAGTRPRVASVDAGLVPKGEPLGGKSAKAATKQAKSRKETKAERKARLAEREVAAARSVSATARVAPPVPKPERTASEGTGAELPALASSATAASVSRPVAPPAPVAKPAPVPAPAIAAVPATKPAPAAASMQRVAEAQVPRAKAETAEESAAALARA
ncbi:MAG: tetratricopeptide repeat protein, partial [Novosphingobium sp.]|nr:tetratricopeptide repeat protein [Novosphingobium sp.]